MNRFSNYLSSQKLAKMHLVTAESRLNKKDIVGALEFTIASLRAFQTASNNIASLAFEPKKKYKGGK